MIRNFWRRWACVCVPKCGTRTLHQLLCSRPFGGEEMGHGPVGDHSTAAPFGWFTFVVCRDPFERAESVWRYCRRILHTEQPFDPFVRDMMSRRADHGWAPYNTTQAEWIDTMFEPPKAVLRLSNLQNDLESLGLHSEPFRAPRNNASPWHEPTEWASGLRDEFAAWAAEDLKRGYGRDLIALPQPVASTP